MRGRGGGDDGKPWSHRNRRAFDRQRLYRGYPRRARGTAREPSSGPITPKKRVSRVPSPGGAAKMIIKIMVHGYSNCCFGVA